MVAQTLLRGESSSGLRPVNLSHDLGQIARLLELVFGHEMDPEARAAMREMQWLARSGPWLWFLARLTQVGEGFTPGFVWIEDGQVVGNISIRRTGARGEGYLVGNVAVHPDWRRQGIGRALMQAAIGLMEKHDGEWVGLLVEDDNLPAIRLYETLAFHHLGAITTWRGESRPARSSKTSQVSIRKRRAGEWEAEYHLALEARPPGLNWIEPLSRSDFRPTLLPLLDVIVKGRREEHWLVAEGERLLAALRVVQSWTGAPHELALYVLPQARGRFEPDLLAHGLVRLGGGHHPVQIEHPAGDEAAEAALRALGFRPTRTLVHMKFDRKR